MWSAVIVLGASVALGASSSAQPDALARARQAYNARQFDAAIAAATDARRVPKLADPAAVVLARALLERYRERQSPDDLSMARDALKQADLTKLSPSDQIDDAIGLGEALYFEERYGAAAETFELALESPDGPQGAARDRLLEWWAGSIDQQAQFGPDADRRPLYQRILDRAAAELARNTRSAVATYWLAAAARGADDGARAWSAAIAGWIRAGSMADHGGTLRADLDRLVTQAILPDRAKILAPADPQSALPGLLQEWGRIKNDWGLPDAAR